LGQGSVESGFVGNIQGNGLGVLEALAQLLGALEGSAGNGNLDVGLAQNLDGRLGDCEKLVYTDVE
jgi:hypothetical protein